MTYNLLEPGGCLCPISGAVRLPAKDRSPTNFVAKAQSELSAATLEWPASFLMQLQCSFRGRYVDEVEQRVFRPLFGLVLERPDRVFFACERGGHRGISEPAILSTLPSHCARPTAIAEQQLLTIAGILAAFANFRKPAVKDQRTDGGRLDGGTSSTSSSCSWPFRLLL